MSFAFKKISPSDVTTTKYSANKSFNYKDTELSGSGINIFIGENNPLGVENSFDPLNDNKTTNDEYKRFVFDSIKHLFYKNYISFDYFTRTSSRPTEFPTRKSSSYEEYPQTTLFSGSFTTNIRKINNIPGSSFQGQNSIYNAGLRYDETALYDESNYDAYKGSIVNVISVDKKLYGDKIFPNTFLINDETYYIKDDGEGNIFDYTDESNYNDIIESGIPTAIYVGNIFYSLGIIIITNPEYVCILGTPPTAINDYISFNPHKAVDTYDILGNDFSDCDGLDYSSVKLINLEDKDFPDCYIGDDSMLHIIRNQKSFIPGNYQIGYTINNNNGLESNLGLVNLNTSTLPTNIINFTSSLTCKNSISNISMSFGIEYGIPTHSYSFDNITYTPISGFFNTFVSTSHTPNINDNILYIKDYTNNILEYNFNPFSPDIIYGYTVNKSPYCSNTGSIYVSSSNGTHYNLNGGISRSLNTTIPLPTGSYTGSIYNTYGCYETFLFDIIKKDPITYTLTTQSVSCYNGNDGVINIQDILGGNNDVRYTISLTSSSFSSTSSLNSNLYSGIYNLSITDGDSCITTGSIILNQSSQLGLTATSSYINDCKHVIIINGSGGISPYKYKIQTPSNIYISDDNTIPLSYDNLDAIYITSSIIDNNNCISDPIYTEIYGRTYIYSGSYCEQI